MTYASETWVLKETIIQKILVFERKILRRIFGPTKENQIWEVKTNEELDEVMKHKNIINYIEAQRLSWFCHIQRMPDTRTVKKIFNWKPLTKRSQGRPKYRWEYNIKQDIYQMKIKKLDSLRTGSREVERGRWEGQNFQLGSSAPGRRRRNASLGVVDRRHHDKAVSSSQPFCATQHTTVTRSRIVRRWLFCQNRRL